MNTDSNLSRQTWARAPVHAGFAPEGTAPSPNAIRYVCTTHAEIVSDAPNACPRCGSSLIPMHQAIAHAAVALRSLSAVTRALRLFPV